MDNNFIEKLKFKMDEFAHGVYRLTLKFPKSEIFGIVSQIRRSSLSVILNFIEGFARQRSQVKKNFWEISYGSLKESKYLLNFSYKEKYISEKEYTGLVILADEILLVRNFLMPFLK